MVYPSLVGIEKISVSGTASSVAANGSATITVPLNVDGVIVGSPIVSSVSANGDVDSVYVTKNGIVVKVSNTDSANAHDITVSLDVWIYPTV